MIRRTIMIVLTAAVLIWFPSAKAAAETVDFGYISDDTGLTVYVNNYSRENSYEVSINGGKTFIPLMGREGMHFSTLPDGTYQLCMMQNDDRSTLTDIQAASIGDSGICESKEIMLLVDGIRETGYKQGAIRTEIKNYKPGLEYMISYNDGKSWSRVKSRVTVREDIHAGDYSVKVRVRKNPSITSRNVPVTVPVSVYSSKAFIETPIIKQMPELPTGCEITSLTMALHFYGIKVSKTVMADQFLEKGEYRAADYRKVFVGNPREINAYGCFADVIYNSAVKFLETVRTRSFDVINLSGCSPERLYSYADMGYPVIVWATSKCSSVKPGPTWVDKESGTLVTWPGNEHCMLLTGYDLEREIVYVNDPQQGVVYYPMKLFEQRFEDMEQQAIVIVETT